MAARRRRLALAAPVAILALYVLAMAVAPALRPSAVSMGTALYERPSLRHPFGTDRFGRDLLDRVVISTELTLVVALTSTALAGVAGTGLGLGAAYSGGVASSVIMRGVDVIVSVPPIVLAIFVVTVWGSGVGPLIVTLGLLGVPAFIRLAYGQGIQVRELDYIQAAVANGCSPARIIRVHVLRNVMMPILVQGALWAGQVVIVTAALGFLGLGPPPPAVTWGSMIADAFNDIAEHPGGVLWPAGTLSLFVIALNWLIDAVRERNA